MNQISELNRLQGAMAASAIGGALGNPAGLITDDTQMALFTAEGLILSRVRSEYSGEDTATAVFHSLLRWLYTQQTHLLGDMMKSYGSCSIVDGILMGHKELFALRDPSGTCLEVLAKGTMGTLECLPNNSSGPGALVRTLPVGLAFTDAETAFDIGCRTTAITHGHRDAVLCSGIFAALMSQILAGQPLAWALKTAKDLLRAKPDHERLLQAMEKTTSMAASNTSSPSPDTIDRHFSDKTAVSTFCAGLFCAIHYSGDLNRGLLLSVDHSRNTDETGAVAGAILGGLNGVDDIPGQLMHNLELKAVILEIAADIFDQFHKPIT